MVTRSDFNLPPVDSGLILSKVTEASAIQKLAGQIALPGTGSIVHTFDSGEASYVTEGGRKKVVTNTGGSFTVSAEKFGKVVLLTEELTDDSPALGNAIYEEIPKTFGTTIDRIVIGDSAKPTGNFDSLAGAPTRTVGTVADAYAALSAVEAKKVNPSGWLFTSSMFYALAGKVNSSGNPVFDFSGGTFLGLDYAIVKSTTQAAWVGPFASRAVWGAVEGTPKVIVSTEGTVILDDGTVVSLLQENKIGVVAEARYGFRVADVTEFVKITPAATS